MAITENGVNFIDAFNGAYFYGDGASGSVSVDGGSLYTVSAGNSNNEPLLIIGNSNGGGGNGTADVSGIGSTILVDSNGNSGSGAGTVIGNGLGSIGSMNIGSGGALLIQDFIGNDFGSEYLQVGAVGDGFLSVLDGYVEVAGTGANLIVGIAGGTGNATFSGTSGLMIESLSNATTNFAEIIVGIDSAPSTLTFSGSSASVVALGNDNVNFSAGVNDGTGIALFNAGSSLNLTGGDDLATFMGIAVGNNSTNQSQNSAVGELKFNNSTFSVSGGGEIFMNVGRNIDGFGQFELANSSSMTWDSGGPFAGFNIGRGTDAFGSMTINSSTATINATAGEIYGTIGRAGATGIFNMDAGSMISTATNFAGINVGRDAGSVGTINLTGGSLLEYNSEVAGYTTVGRNGGTGTLNIDASTFRLSGTGILDGQGNSAETGLQIGRDGIGSDGEVNITNGGLLELLHDGSDVFMNIGRTDTAIADLSVIDSTLILSGTGTEGGAYMNVARAGSTANVIVDNATVDVVSELDFATLRVGANFDGTGTSDASVKLENSSDVLVSGNTAVLSVGYTLNAIGLLEVLSGSTISVLDSGGMLDGTPYGSFFLVGHLDGVPASNAVIDGIGSSVTGMDATVIGFNRDFFMNPTGLGNGTLAISNGGTLVTDSLTVGAGGTLILDEGNVDAFQDGMELNAGTIRVIGGESVATGDITVNEGTVEFEIDVAANTNGSVTLTSGDVVFSEFGTINVDVQNGFLSKGSSYELFSLTGGVVLESEGFFDVLGQDAGFGWAYARTTTSGTLYALNNGDGTGVADLDFGATSTVGADFEYFSTTGEGFGSGGDLGDEVGAVNVDRIFGTDASDTFFDFGDAGMIAYGRGGEDNINGGTGNDILFGGDDADTISGAKGNDTINGGDGGDTLNGNRGNDFINPGEGADIINGGGDFDRVWYGDSAAGVTVNLINGNGSGGNAAGDTYTGIERVTGSAEDDTIFGTAVANALKGQSGNDTIYGVDGRDVIEGQGGDDILFGGNSNDVVVGGAGNDDVYGNRGFDRIDGGLGDDNLWGGNDIDYFRFVTEGTEGFGNDIIFDFDDGADRLDVRGVYSTSNPSNTADSFGDFTVTDVAIGVKVRFEAGQVIFIDNSDNGMTSADITAADFVFA